jgi:hypothetical protein
VAGNKQPEQHDILQSVYNGITEVMNDVRHKVIEEPWFNHENGRTITDDIPTRDAFYEQPSWAAGRDAWSSEQDRDLPSAQDDDRREQAQDNARDYAIER